MRRTCVLVCVLSSIALNLLSYKAAAKDTLRGSEITALSEFLDGDFAEMRMEARDGRASDAYCEENHYLPECRGR